LIQHDEAVAGDNAAKCNRAVKGCYRPTCQHSSAQRLHRIEIARRCSADSKETRKIVRTSRTTRRVLTRAADAHPPLFTRAFVLAALANAMLSLAAFLFVHLPGFLQQLGAGEAHIGRIMAAQALGAVLAWPMVGRVMDASGRRVVILAGVALFVAVIGMYLSIDALGPRVYGVRLLDGVASMMWYTALFTYAADLVPAERRTEGLAIFGVSGLIPIGLGAQAGDVILAFATYRELFLAALGFAVLGLILCLPLRDLRPVHQGMPPRSILATVAQRNLLPVWLAALTFFIAVLALFSFMKTFVITTGIGSVGMFFGAYTAMAVSLRIFLGWLPDRLGARRMLGIAMPCFACGFVVLSLVRTPAHVFAAGLLCGAGHGYTFPVLLSLVVARAGPQERGAATAFFSALDWLGLLLAGPVVGYIIEHAGYGRSFMNLAFLLVVGVGGFYALDRPHAARA
jgi:MFS family permease